MRKFRVAVVGAGPAGIYAADILTKEHEGASVDVIERLPAPYGLVRYGVAPDHPRIKEIVKALRRVLDRDSIRFLGNVEYGRDVTLDELKRHYDAVIFSTGAMSDRSLDIPGVDLEGSHGAADFVSWYAGHPDVPSEWPLDARSVAVIGAGNVALDVARMLAKPADEQLTTEIADNVYQGLKANQATDVHVFARRGPAEIKFSPMELRELSHSPSIDVLVEEEGFQIDDDGQSRISSNKGVRLVVDTLLKYLEAEPTGAQHRIHIHMCHARSRSSARTARSSRSAPRRPRWTAPATPAAPASSSTPRSRRSTARSATAPPAWPTCPSTTSVAWCATTADGSSTRTASSSPGSTSRAGSSAGRSVSSATPSPTPARPCATCSPTSRRPLPRGRRPRGIVELLLDRGVGVTTWEGWERLDAHEVSLGEASGRERIKVVPREEMLRISQGSDSRG